MSTADATYLRGTCSRVDRYVRGDCGCGERGTLVYDHPDDTGDMPLVCAGCYRRAVAGRKHEEACDRCGATGAWRDPITGKNDFYCAQCHAKAGRVFQNRWAGAEARMGRVLGVHDKAVCFAADKGTECKGEIKPRSAFGGQLICNKHAGKQSSGPEWHQ